MTPSPESPSPSATPSTSSAPDDELAGWSLAQKVGQLLVVGVSVSDPEPVSARAVRQHHVGNIFLHGRSDAGVAATRDLVERYTGLVSPRTTRGTPMLVATDQEGGKVQVLTGPGFSDIPAATEQATWPVTTLENRAERWGTELADAGVNLNLAPVMDLVPRESAADNAPVGAFDRSYGFTAASVSRSAQAFSAGMESARVAPVIKHFPGLGRVTQNTDGEAGVTDDVTGPGAPSVRLFADAIDDGAPYVMVATAVYTRIDPDDPAAFSRDVVTGLLRDHLGFDGVVMTDDVSATAQVQPWTPGERAVRAVDAGVDLVLASADPTVVPAMADALVAEARRDPEFAERVDESARRILAAKAALGD
ncbi:glycoside hydrolase family 3 protein [Isoptericola sp. NEAU-Y5]|uniref:beta-N-acetylhexosaminidase n=1 Tax=Isoptericola luteus TaxID=2879484 RepID=A0ABS7Z9S1_9MICO|nr:glycoside hydrolase family 3 N-terminal domain-containing protein [Isoptericola sp. NEAU-Y5]MCA5891803.1 glycoside hydrolase family 3 protein [Isoptericola sp. NEAU-Y5]